MKSKLSFLILLGAILLSSCGNNDITYKKIITPKGAPALAFVKESKNLQYLETNDKASLVGAQLLNNEYGAVVFDFYNGLKAIKNSQKQKSPFKLFRMITNSNIYLLGIGENNNGLPKAGDRIVSFGENLLPDLVFKSIFADELSTFNVEYTASGVSDILPVISSGNYSSTPVDYVVVAEPIMTRGIKAGTANGLVYPYKTALSTLWGHEIPQAGLFINSTLYEANKSYFDNFLNTIDSSIKYAIGDNENPTYLNLADQMDTDYPSATYQKMMFGFSSTEVREIQTTNGFGMVKEDNDTKQTVNNFLSRLGISENYDDYIFTK